MIRRLLIIVNCICLLYMVYTGIHEVNYNEGLIDFIIAGCNLAAIVINMSE